MIVTQGHCQKLSSLKKQEIVCLTFILTTGTTQFGLGQGATWLEHTEGMMQDLRIHPTITRFKTSYGPQSYHTLHRLANKMSKHLLSRAHLQDVLEKFKMAV